MLPKLLSVTSTNIHTDSSGKYINSTATRVDIPCVYRVCVLYNE